jgi:hypothetical protein
MGAVHPNGEGYKEVSVGEEYEIGLSVMSKGESQTLPQRGEVLH